MNLKKGGIKLTKIYNITMNTPFGIQQGKITFVIKDESLTGTLEGMGSKSKFNNGKINGNSFEFSGQIRTLITSIQYTAKGTLNNDMLSAAVNTKYGVFSVIGKLVSQS